MRRTSVFPSSAAYSTEQNVMARSSEQVTLTERTALPTERTSAVTVVGTTTEIPNTWSTADIRQSATHGAFRSIEGSQESLRETAGGSLWSSVRTTESSSSVAVIKSEWTQAPGDGWSQYSLLLTEEPKSGLKATNSPFITTGNQSSTIVSYTTDKDVPTKDFYSESQSFSTGNTEESTETLPLSNTTVSWTRDSESGTSSIYSSVTPETRSLTDTSSKSFLFVNSTYSNGDHVSVSNFTLPSFIGVDFTNVSNNSTILPAQTTFGDVISNDNAVDEVNTAEMVTKAVTLTILAAGGVLGNALVILSVVKRRHLHRPPFYYLLSLSLTDLSRAAFCLPLVLMTLLQGSVWRHGNSACDLFAFANSFFVLSSSVSLLNVAADRHLSLVYSRSYRRRAGGAVNLVVVLLGWTLAFLVAFPPVVGVGSYAFEVSEGQCTLRHKYYRHDNDTLGFLMVFTGVSMLTLFLYYRIFLALRAHRKMRPLQHEPARSATWTFVGPGANGQAFINWMNGFGGVNQPNAPNLARNPPRPNLARVVSLHVARNQHVTRLFFVMTLTFVGLWLPYQVLSYWRVFSSSGQPGTTFVTVAAWLSYAQVAACPLVYFFVRGPMRRRPSRADLGADGDKPEYLLESIHRKK